MGKCDTCIHSEVCGLGARLLSEALSKDVSCRHYLNIKEKQIKKFNVDDIVMVTAGIYDNRIGKIIEICNDGMYRVGFEGGWFDSTVLEHLDLANEGLYIKEEE